MTSSQGREVVNSRENELLNFCADKTWNLLVYMKRNSRLQDLEHDSILDQKDNSKRKHNQRRKILKKKIKSRLQSLPKPIIKDLSLPKSDLKVEKF